ncbi:hypothetical protein PVK06_023769 [Gossypium arboreum]|uniref:Uncharacterized protein n=1 Tax=Gossypium arboreum TaxID=29729 RepID=A0ABR0PC52_GOSAR|nr:hypothetical protein PVK06_023769 [Gossypium arboreum]
MLSSGDEPRAISVYLRGITQYLSVVRYRVILDIYYKDFLGTPGFSTLLRHIHRSTPLYWFDIAE